MATWIDWFIYYYRSPLDVSGIYADFTGHEEDIQRALAVRWMSLVKGKKLHEVAKWEQKLKPQRARAYWRRLREPKRGIVAALVAAAYAVASDLIQYTDIPQRVQPVGDIALARTAQARGVPLAALRLLYGFLQTGYANYMPLDGHHILARAIVVREQIVVQQDNTTARDTMYIDALLTVAHRLCAALCVESTCSGVAYYTNPKGGEVWLSTCQ